MCLLQSLDWQDIRFPAINLWSAPRLNMMKMSNCREKIDDDLDYFYDYAEKIGKRPTEMQEEQFINRVFDLVMVENISDIEARRMAFAEVFYEQ